MLPPGSRVPVKPPARHQIVDRLIAAKEAWVKPPTFEVGNVVRPAPFVAGYGPDATTSTEGVVMETCRSLRHLLGEQHQPDSQGILIAFVSGNDVAFGWYGSWQYVLAEPLPARALNA